MGKLGGCLLQMPLLLESACMCVHVSHRERLRKRGEEREQENEEKGKRGKR